jgi:putative membrane protein
VVRNFADHAANERTFLAWVRTAIAIMAFGFLVEKFDLFLQLARASLLARTPPPHNRVVGEASGLVLIVFGLAIVVVATTRFLKTAREIDDQTQHLGSGSRFDLALAALLLLLGCALLAYLAYTLVRMQ